jgi:hypothetical protein
MRNTYLRVAILPLSRSFRALVGIALEPVENLDCLLTAAALDN